MGCVSNSTATAYIIPQPVKSEKRGRGRCEINGWRDAVADHHGTPYYSSSLYIYIYISSLSTDKSATLRIQIRDIICTVRMEMMRQQMMRQQIKICPEIEIKILVAQQNICRPLSLINKYYNHQVGKEEKQARP